MFIEGKNAVIEALRARMPIRRIFLAEAQGPADRVRDDIVRLATKDNVTIKKVTRRELDDKSDRGAHQGVIAEAAPFNFTALEQVLRATSGDKPALIIVLDHITDPGNLGAAVRSAEVIGAAAVVIPKRRMASITPAAWKAAAGAFAHMPIVQEANVAQTLKKLKDAGWWVAGASEHAKEDVWHSPLEGKIALVMGSEGKGLAQLTQQSCDFLVRLPQSGKVGSLNVAQAATALSYEWLRQNTMNVIDAVPEGAPELLNSTTAEAESTQAQK